MKETQRRGRSTGTTRKTTKPSSLTECSVIYVPGIGPLALLSPDQLVKVSTLNIVPTVTGSKNGNGLSFVTPVGLSMEAWNPSSISGIPSYPAWSARASLGASDSAKPASLELLKPKSLRIQKLSA